MVTSESFWARLKLRNAAAQREKEEEGDGESSGNKEKRNDRQNSPRVSGLEALSSKSNLSGTLAKQRNLHNPAPKVSPQAGHLQWMVQRGSPKSGRHGFNWTRGGLSKPSGCAGAVVSTHSCKKPFGPHCPVRSTRPSVLLQLTCKRALTLSGLGNISVSKPLLHLVGVS